MKAERLIRSLTTEPWYMGRDHFVSILQLVPAAIGLLKGGKLVIEASAFTRAQEEGRRNRLSDSMHMDGHVAVIPVNGVIACDLEDWERCYATDMDELTTLVNVCANDDNVAAIMLHFDSPGGTVRGCLEAAEKIAAASQLKPVVAFTDRMCASAAYFLAAGATAIYASRTSYTGSIGVYLPLLDISGLYEKLGLRVDLIVNESGTLKTSGYPGTSLTDPQRADLQSLVEHAFGMFSGFVEEHRDVSEDAMKGQCFWGDQAVEMGLVDEIQDYAGAIDQAMRLA